jgi:hypothetical protein
MSLSASGARTSAPIPVLPALASQKADTEQFACGWISEADRHRKLITRLDDLIGATQAGRAALSTWTGPNRRAPNSPRPGQPVAFTVQAGFSL